MSVRAGALVLLLLGCARGDGRATVEPHDQVGVFVRNRSQEIVCEARIDPSGARTETDALEPAEVLAPGASRFFALEPGTYDVHLVDCNGTVMLRRERVPIGAEGVMISFQERR